MPSAEAWADESFAERASAGFYILAATLVPANRRDHVRTIMRALRGNHSGKLHWNDLEPRERKHAAEQVAALDEVHVVVAASPVPVRRQERARRVCLERLIIELHQQGVTTLFMESRGSRRLDSLP
ncbi:hypothetical protein ABN034_12470 [Actinopolymorpha sp. B11F2]|uniref:hypothetical protein n=1 Tax=Actinopolymorpha sp. B11F2 TaxID=3160862 RepID=UPI0032E45439